VSGHLDKFVGLFLVVALPLGLGLGAEYVFELLRRRKKPDGANETGEV
jgi:hypothetical protein